MERHEAITAEIFQRGLLEIACKFPPKDTTTLAMVYTPGVGSCCMAIKDDPAKAYELTNKLNTMFVISDGSTLPSFIKKDPILVKQPELQAKYLKLYEANGKKNTQFVLPLVEYHSFLYKAMINIDAYPLVFNNKIDSPESLLLSLKSIATTTQAVELASVDKSLYASVQKEINELPLVTVLPLHRRFLRKSLKKLANNKFSRQYIINIILFF